MIPLLVVANWKMAIDRAAVGAFRRDWESREGFSDIEVVIAPPALFLPEVESLPGVAVAGQDVSAQTMGAHTGEIAADMLADYGCTYGLVGHSERRQSHLETDDNVAQKAQRLVAVGIRPIVCVGESTEVRQRGDASEFVSQQVLDSCRGLTQAPVIAYEPVWAIGSGAAASPEVADAMHRVIKETLASVYDADIPVLYGGSVTAENAREFTRRSSIDGLLVGGASLKAESFWSICDAAREDRDADRG